MAGDDEYELLPKEEVDMLKKEVERLKKHPLGDLPEGESILDAINNLNANIKKLIDIFTKAQAELADEYGKSNPVEDINTIREQNEQIAQGVVAVADMVKDMKEVSKGPPISPEPKMPTPYTAHEMPPPMNRPPELPPHLPSPPPMGPGDQGPPPPQGEPFPDRKKKHKGLFHRK